MTPQLQQAIRLLQLSTLDLQIEIQATLDANFMLERADEEDTHGAESGAASVHDAAPTEHESRDSHDVRDTQDAHEPHEGGEPEGGDRELSALADSLPDDLPVDSNWDDTFDGSTSYSRGEDDDDRDVYASHSAGDEGLAEHLRWQLRHSRLSEVDATIAEAILDCLDDDGYLRHPLEDILLAAQKDYPEVGMEEVQAVLRRIQSLDPVGCAARDPSECLLIQLQQMPAETLWREQAMRLVRDFLDLLGTRDYTLLMKKLGLTQPQLAEVITLIQRLNPRPGNRISSAWPEYIVPDVIVRRVGGQWRVELNPEIAPKLRINAGYASMVRRSDKSADNNLMRSHLQEARWFIKSLQSRNETLLKVAQCIVERQRRFLDEGEAAMQPMVLRDVASVVGMHESTISRITTSKYLHTPRGVYEFKYFFSSHVGTSDGGECSATAIRARIKQMVQSEAAGKPLSDSAIAVLLTADGINVARRTVAKYREAMGILPSSERKRLL